MGNSILMFVKTTSVACNNSLNYSWTVEKYGWQIFKFFYKYWMGDWFAYGALPIVDYFGNLVAFLLTKFTT